jgi:hypothetical protein
MSYIKDYKRFKINEDVINRNVDMLLSVDLSQNDEEIFKFIFESSLLKVKDKLIRKEIEIYLYESELLTEGFFDKLKKRFPKAAQVSKKLSEKGESILNTLLQKAKDAVSFIKKISDGINEFFKSVVVSSKAYFIEQLKIGELKKKLEEVEKNEKDGLLTDLKTTKVVLEFYRKLFLSKMTNSTKNNLSKFFTEDQVPVSEKMVNEGKNVIATFVHNIEKVPPFSWLHKIAVNAEKGVNVLVQVVSDFTQSIGGPKFQIPVISALIALGIEYIIKNASGHWLLDLGGPTPLGLAIKGIKITATLIALISAIDMTINANLLTHHEHKPNVPATENINT